MHLPLISIITVVYNAHSSLESTIKSVIEQNGELFEYWIIDGNSSDGSVDIIRRYEDHLTGWISEPDTGIYEAMNKGIDKAKGKWIYFLGADDQLKPGILEKISTMLVPDLSAVFGDVVYDTGYVMHSQINYTIVLQNTLHHQATFYNSTLFKKFRYDTSYKVVSDYELNLKIFLENLLTAYVPHVITTCGSNGVSSTLSSNETNIIRGKYIKSKTVNLLLSKVLDTYFFCFKAKASLKIKFKKFFMSNTLSIKKRNY